MKPIILEKNHQANPKSSKSCWFENLDFTSLLDIITSTLAEEYVEIAKRNPNVFSNEK